MNLMPVITWLENGCDPKEAAKELRIYQSMIEKQVKYMPLMDTPLAMRFDALDEDQAVKNRGQTLDRLRQRGGLGLSEAAAVKDRRAWRAMTASDALCALATPNSFSASPGKPQSGEALAAIKGDSNEQD